MIWNFLKNLTRDPHLSFLGPLQFDITHDLLGCSGPVFAEPQVIWLVSSDGLLVYLKMHLELAKFLLLFKYFIIQCIWAEQAEIGQHLRLMKNSGYETEGGRCLGRLNMWFTHSVINPFISIDVNECYPSEISKEYKNLSHNCHGDANCTNTKGSFYCTCLNGYSGDGIMCVGENELYESAMI